MDTATFLRHVLPSQGYYFLAVPNGDFGFKHKAFSTPEGLAAGALALSDKGLNTYFAVAGYDKPEYFVTIDGETKKKWRTKDNAVSARCFWMDIDCQEEGMYKGSKAAGAKDLARFCKEANLPFPNYVVDSGNGLHAYWKMNIDVPKDQWNRIAAIIKALAKKLNFAQDDVTRTADIASVLRPIGTNNDKTHKNLGIKPVKLLRENNAEVKVQDFVKALVDARTELGVAEPKVHQPKAPSLNDALMIKYPDASAVTIALHCKQMRLMQELKGANQNEPTWRNCLGIIKHCIEGDALAHEWSKGYEAYDAAETQKKLDGWNAGPTTCEKFGEDNAPGCQGCKKKCKSPIQLGEVAPEHVEEVIHLAPIEVEDELNNTVTAEKVEPLPPLPASIKKKFAYNPDQGLRGEITDAEGVKTWVTFSNTYIRPYDYFRDEDDGRYKLRFEVRTKPFEWKQHEMDVKSVGSGNAVLMGEMASRAMVTTRHPKLLEEYMRTWVEEMQQNKDEMVMHDHLGWQEDNSFVTGTTRYYKDGTTKEVVLNDKLRKTVKTLGFKNVGDRARYTHLIDYAYNRPNHEAYQMSYIAGFASPLVNLLESGPMGILFSGWSNDSGFGKTTAAKLGAGIFYDPMSVLQAGRTTEYALFLHAGMRRNLVTVVDELTEWATDRSANFAYNYSSGMAKEQGAAAGGLRDNAKYNWNAIGVCTGNKSQHANIRMHNQECQAQLARVFEYEFTAGHTETLSKDEGHEVMQELMGMQGVFAADYATYLVKNRDAIKTRLQTTFNSFMTNTGVSKAARFWVIGCSAAWVGFCIAKELGVHNFDGKAFAQWLKGQLIRHDKVSRAAAVDYGSMFGEVVNSLHSKFIITADRGTRGTKARIAPGYSIPRNGIVGRCNLAEGDMFVSVAAVTDWCKEHKADKAKMIRDAKAMGYIIGSATERLGSCTDVHTPPVRVYVLDPSKFEQPHPEEEQS